MVLKDDAEYEAVKFGYPDIVKDVRKGIQFYKLTLDFIRIEDTEEIATRRGRAIRKEGARLR